MYWLRFDMSVSHFPVWAESFILCTRVTQYYQRYAVLDNVGELM